MPLSYNIALSHPSEGLISAIAFSPDAHYLVIANTCGGLKVFETASGAAVLSLDRKGSSISSVVWTGTGLLHEFTFTDSQGFIVTVVAADEVSFNSLNQ